MLAVKGKIAYFFNRYPRVVDGPIRREVLALERQGLDVLRVALRGWDGELVDDEARRERQKTRYVLQGGLLALLGPALRTLATSPRAFFSALGLALRMGWRAERPLPYHLVYLAEACRMLPWLRSFGATHVHAHYGTNSAEVVMLARALGGPPYSFTVHGPEEFDKPQLLGISEKVRRAAFVVTISSFGRSQLYRWIGRTCWPKVKVVHCGLEPTFHDLDPVPPPEAPRLVCVGRLCEQKGQLLLVEAARRLAEKGVAFELVLVGDGEMRADIQALIARYGLEKKVRITGSISTEQLRAEILMARGLVLPSFAEGLPMAVMEAMSLRRPVLTTYVAGIPELVRHGQEGWLFPAGSIEALTAVIEDFLERSPAELSVIGEAAYRRVIERHSLEAAAQELAGLFRASG
jgi:colanic acid/amylovoran biosynthesis glycosyltransferase